MLKREYREGYEIEMERLSLQRPTANLNRILTVIAPALILKCWGFFVS